MEAPAIFLKNSEVLAAPREELIVIWYSESGEEDRTEATNDPFANSIESQPFGTISQFV